MQQAPTTPQATPVTGQGGIFERLFRHVSPQATDLVLVRHAEAAPASPQEATYDPPLSERGRQQAQLLARRLARMSVHALYSSPLRRAQETAAAVAAATGLPIHTIPDLREVDIDLARLRATYEGQSPQAVADDLAARLLALPRWDALPGCEPSHRFRLRVHRALQEMVARHPAQRVVVVCHGGVINIYLSLVLDIPRDIFFLPQHTSLTIVRTDGQRAAVQTIGDCAHLYEDSLAPILGPDMRQNLIRG